MTTNSLEADFRPPATPVAADLHASVPDDQINPLAAPVDEVPLVAGESLELSADEAEVEPIAAPLPPSAELAQPAPVDAASADNLPPLRQSLLQRIHESTTLPLGIRGRLTSALQGAPLVQQDGQLLAPVDVWLSALEQWTPDALRLDPQSLRRSEHPAGDTFFTGDPGDVSDEQAERIARQQLQRSGYLPRGKSS